MLLDPSASYIKQINKPSRHSKGTMADSQKGPATSESHGITQDQATSVRPAKGRKRIDGQAEMLLPIAGKAEKAVAAKSTVRPSARRMKAG
jgi:hypothetical protein